MPNARHARQLNIVTRWVKSTWLISVLMVSSALVATIELVPTSPHTTTQPKLHQACAPSATSAHLNLQTQSSVYRRLTNPQLVLLPVSTAHLASTALVAATTQTVLRAITATSDLMWPHPTPTSIKPRWVLFAPFSTTAQQVPRRHSPALTVKFSAK